MKRYKILKPIPGISANQIIETEEYIQGFRAILYPDFFEEVKERESLEEKIEKKFFVRGLNSKVIYSIVKSHYLSIFDEAAKEFRGCPTTSTLLMGIRKRLEEG